MAIRAFHRNPKKSDFKYDDIIVDIKEGSLFFKSNSGVHKITADKPTKVEDTSKTVAYPLPSGYLDTNDAGNLLYVGGVGADTPFVVLGVYSTNTVIYPFGGFNLELHASQQATSQVDTSSLTLSKDTATATIKGDLIIQSNTEDSTNNIGVGNIQADGDITTGGDLISNRIILEGTNENGATTQYELIINDGQLEINPI